MSERMTVHILVKGSVQGIGYRYFVQDVARQMGIDGWVRNLSNGDVEIEAGGTNDIIEGFTHAIRTQHPFARVEDMKIEPITAGSDEHTGFKIIH